MNPQLRSQAERIARIIRDQSFLFKKASLHYKEEIVSRQVVQARLADTFIYLFAMVATLSRIDDQIKRGDAGPAFDRDREAALFFFDYAEIEIRQRNATLFKHADDAMLKAAEAAIVYNDSLPNADFIVPEKSPVAAGTGRTPDQTDIAQFPGDGLESQIEEIAAGTPVT